MKGKQKIEAITDMENKRRETGGKEGTSIKMENKNGQRLRLMNHWKEISPPPLVLAVIQLAAPNCCALVLSLTEML